MQINTNINSEAINTDVVVLGGGLVGLSLANLLAELTDYSILLVEPKTPPLTWDSATYDIKVSAISRASQNLFSRLGAWQDILQHRVGIYHDMLVWDGATGAEISFNGAELGETDLGHIIENRVMQSVLWQKLQQRDNVIIANAKAKQMLPQDNCQQLILQGDGDKEFVVNTCLVVGADGANSWLRQYQRIGATTWNVEHHALVATIATTKPHGNVARQCFVASESGSACGSSHRVARGPSILAFLSLAEPNLSSIVWSCSPQQTIKMMDLPEVQFNLQLEQAFAATLGATKLIGKRACFPIKPLHTDTYIGCRTALIGDAAHVVHPLAGQGLNLGLQDVVVLAKLLQQYGLGKTNVGSRKVLRKYERARRGDNLLMLKAFLGFKDLFAAESSGIKKIRSTGIQLTNQFKWLKQILTHKAMGC